MHTRAFHMGLLAASVLLAALLVLPQPLKAAEDKIYRWDFMIYLPLNQSPAPFYVEFADEVREKTGGRLDITVRPGGELPYEATDALRVVYRNQVQMADANTGFISGDVTIAQIFNMPFLITSKEEFLEAGEVLDPVLDSELQPYNAEILFKFNWPGQHIWGVGTPVRDFEDLAGLKVRTYAPEQQVFLRRIGAVPVSLTFAEVPGAIQRGVIDAVMTSGLSVFDAKMHEYLDWGFLAHYNIASNYIVINSQAKQELPDDLKTVLEETAAKYQERIMAELPTRNETALNGMEKEGMTIVDARGSAVAEGSSLMSDYWDDWAAQNGYEDVMGMLKRTLDKQ